MMEAPEAGSPAARDFAAGFAVFQPAPGSARAP